MVPKMALSIDQLARSACDLAVGSKTPAMRTRVRVSSTSMPAICAWTVARRTLNSSPTASPFFSANSRLTSTPSPESSVTGSPSTRRR